MTRDEKNQVIDDLTAELDKGHNFLLLDMGGLNVGQTNTFRQKLYDQGFKVSMAKNTLIKKAMEASGLDYSEVYPALAQPSSIMFVDEDVKLPAKVLKQFRTNFEKPALKAAYVDTAVYLGDDQLTALTKLKSKDELIGEIVGLLQAPTQNLLGQLKSGGDTLHRLFDALQDRGEESS